MTKDKIKQQITFSDYEIRERLTKRFEALEIMSDATVTGKNRSLIVSGPAGLGKSYTIEQTVIKNADKVNSITIKGYVRPTGLYKTLYEHRHSNCVIVFDDADSIFADDVSLNILKGATDSTEKRTIRWLAETKMLDEEGEKLPRSFDFDGSVIYISNYDFDSFVDKGHRLSPHFEALISRSHYLDLAMKTKQDYIVRIEQVIEGGMLKDKLSYSEIKMIMDFIKQFKDNLRELSLRMVLKLTDLYKMDANKWQDLAKITLMK
jgi:hypothetical protein